MTTRSYTPDELDAIGVPFECDTEPDDGHATELHREQIDTRRWVSVHHLVFRAPDDGKAYRVTYEQGLTEHQDDADLWNGDSTVTATEVAQVPKIVQEWRPVGDQSAPEPQPDTVTVTAAHVEAALRGYLAMLDYDLHKNLECGEETGEDTYAEEAADLFGRLRSAAGGEQQ